jgi:hypothetical protein
MANSGPQTTKDGPQRGIPRWKNREKPMEGTEAPRSRPRETTRTQPATEPASVLARSRNCVVSPTAAADRICCQLTKRTTSRALRTAACPPHRQQCQPICAACPQRDHHAACRQSWRRPVGAITASVQRTTSLGDMPTAIPPRGLPNRATSFRGAILGEPLAIQPIVCNKNTHAFSCVLCTVRKSSVDSV